MHQFWRCVFDCTRSFDRLPGLSLCVYFLSKSKLISSSRIKVNKIVKIGMNSEWMNEGQHPPNLKHCSINWMEPWLRKPVVKTLKMTSAQVVETSVTNNSSFQNYTHPDDHTIRTTDIPGFKPFTKLRYMEWKDAVNKMSCLKIISCCPTRFKESNDVTIPYIRQVGTLFRSVLLKSIHPVQGREGRDNTVRHVDTTRPACSRVCPIRKYIYPEPSSEAEKKNLAKKIIIRNTLRHPLGCCASHWYI